MKQMHAAPALSGPGDMLADVIERYGPWRVLGAAAVALVQRRQQGPDIAPADIVGLDDRLRRDIGLPPAFHGAPPPLGMTPVSHYPPWALR